MALILVGISHKTAPLNIREKFSFTKKRLANTLVELKQLYLLEGIVILSTCNRTEIYVQSRDVNADKQKIKGFLCNYFEAKEEDINHYFYTLEEENVIRHIFYVASGLDSQVLGETQILGQIRSAWESAQELGVTGSILDELFQRASYVGRIVRAKTEISKGNVSVGSVAIKMMEGQFKDLGEKLVLIIGAGKIAKLVSKYLLAKGMKGIFVSSRTYVRAHQLALDCRGSAVNFVQLKEKLKIVDIVISSTSSPHLILKKEELIEIMQERAKPLFIMDLALPRDIDPQAKDIPNISLYDLDDLKSVVEENFAKRRQEARLAEMIVERELNKIDCVNLNLQCFPIGYSKLPF